MSHGPRVARAVARRTWRATLRRPVVLTFSFGQPILWMIFFGFLFDRAGFVGEDGTSYRSFLVAGIGVFGQRRAAAQHLIVGMGKDGRDRPGARHRTVSKR